MKSKTITTFIILSNFLLNCHPEKVQDKIGFQYISGVIVVNAKLNNSIEGLFQLDTGANNSFIRKKYANELGISTAGTIKGIGPGGASFESPKAEKLSFSINNHSQLLTDCSIIDMTNQKVPDNFIGLIGSDYLKEFIITIDFKDKTLVFEDIHSLKYRLSSGIKTSLNFTHDAPNIPYVHVTFNDSIFSNYIFDTGVPITTLSYNDFTILGLHNEVKSLEKKSKNILGNNFETYSTTISTFGLDNLLKLSNIKIESCENCSGLIGNNFISKFIITLNYKESYLICKTI